MVIYGALQNKQVGFCGARNSVNDSTPIVGIILEFFLDLVCKRSYHHSQTLQELVSIHVVFVEYFCDAIGCANSHFQIERVTIIRQGPIPF
jgi:hypothetical protein